MNIKQLQLLSNDIPATTAFYRDILELPVVQEDQATVTFRAGGTMLTFRHSDMPQPVYHFAFTVPANQLEDAFLSLTTKSEIVQQPDDGHITDFVNWNAKAFYFLDNNGNIVEYIARHDLKNEATIPFTGSSIIAVSEIGLVTDDVPKLAEHLSEAYSLPFFSKQPRQDHFTALGDDHGLLILVVRNRHWYPTDIPAAVFPALITLEGGQGQNKELSFGF